MGRAGIFPGFLSCWQEKLNSPRAAYSSFVVFSLILLLFVGSSKFVYFNEMSIVIQWFQRSFTACLLLYIRLARVSKNENVYRANILFPSLYLVCMSAIIIGTIGVLWTKAIIPVSTAILATIVYVIFFNKKGLKRFEAYEKLLGNVEGFLSNINNTLDINVKYLDVLNKYARQVFKCDPESRR